MAKVCYFFEPTHVDIFSGTDDSNHAWNNAIKAAGDIDEVAVIDLVGGFKPFDADLPTQVWGSLNEFWANSTGIKTVLDVPWNANTGISLWDFDHQTDWYVFGPGSGWTIQTDNSLVIPQAGIGALHSVHIASIVLLHRYSVIGGV